MTLKGQGRVSNLYLINHCPVQVRELSVIPPADATEDRSQSIDNEDKTVKTTIEDLLAVRRPLSLPRTSQDDQNNAEDRREPRTHCDDVVTPGEWSGKIEQPSYVHLYDEQLIEKNMRCYIQ